MPVNHPNPSDQSCVCGHWPLDGREQIQASALALHALSNLWDGAYDLLEDGAAGRCSCLDVAMIPLDDAQLDLLLLQAVLVPDAVHAMTQTLSALARDFGSVDGWLVGSAKAACLAKTSADLAGRERLTVVRDDHRVIARDWLAADMNAMIAWLLRRAIRVLKSMDLSADSVRADLLGARQHQAALRAAACILDRAALLAVECAAYVEDFNHRWLALRGQAAAATALYPLDNAPLLGSFPPADWKIPATGRNIGERHTVWPVTSTSAASATIPQAA
ncbi:MAG: hypothetical protein LH632_21510 [Rhodoferax sp.]|nr:hypothetical protein [Rhodoferax sp.]